MAPLSPRTLMRATNNDEPADENTSNHTTPSSSKAEDDDLFKLDRSTSEVARQFDEVSRIAQLIDAQTSAVCPRTLARNPDGPTLRIVIRGGRIAPVLRLILDIRHPGIFHTAYLEFSAGQIEDFSTKTESNGEDQNESSGSTAKRSRKPKDEIQQTLISFWTHGGIGSGLDYSHASFSDETNATLARMATFARACDCKSPRKQVNVRTKTNPGFGFRKSRIFESFKSQISVVKLPWSPYRDDDGRPLTQYGACQPRNKVKELSGDGVISYPSCHYFADVDQGNIMLAYGSLLEYRSQRRIFDRAAIGEHSISFLDIGGGNIIARVFLFFANLPPKANFAIKEGTIARLGWRNPANMKRKSCIGIAIPNMFSLPFTETIFSVAGREPDYFDDYLSQTMHSVLNPKRFRLYLTVEANDAGLKRQLDAVHRLCTTRNKWQPIFLNQRTNHPGINIFDCVKLEESRIDSVKSQIFTCPNIQLNGEQRRCIENCASMAGGVLVIQGFAGCGKSVTVAAIANFFLLLGLHVILTAPTPTAADALCENFCSFQDKLGFEGDVPLRTYGGLTTTRAFFEENREREFSVARGSRLSAAVDTIILSLLHLTELLESSSSGSKRRLSSMSVDARAVKIAQENTRIYMCAYQLGDADRDSLSANDSAKNREQDQENRGHLIDSLGNNSHGKEAVPQNNDNVSPGRSGSAAESPAQPPNGCHKVALDTDTAAVEVNMVSELRTFLDMAKRAHPRTWTTTQRQKAAYAFTKVCEMVISEAKVTVSTNVDLASAPLRQYFGKTAKGIVLIRDEDHNEQEANGWIGLTQMSNSSKIQGMALVGDTKQFFPAVISHCRNHDQRYNEFANQLRLSLSARLLQASPAHVNLVEQYRMRPALSAFPNEQIYDGQMKDSPLAQNLKVNQGYERMMRGWLKVTDPKADLGHVVLDVSGSECRVEPFSGSRFNLKHVEAVLEIVIRNWRESGYAPEDVCIMTTDRAQRTKILQALYQLSDDGTIPIDAHPCVATIDSMQGKEFELVIADFVVSKADGPLDLGSSIYHNRNNVAFTRAKTALVVLLRPQISEGSVPGNGLHKPRESREQTFLIDYIAFAKKKEIIYRVGHQDLSPEVNCLHRIEQEVQFRGRSP